MPSCSWGYRCTPPCLAYLLKWSLTNFLPEPQNTILLISTSGVTGITGMHRHTPGVRYFTFYLCIHQWCTFELFSFFSGSSNYLNSKYFFLFVVMNGGTLWHLHRVVSIFDNYEQCYYDYLCTFFVDMFSFCTGMGYGNTVLNILGNCQTIFQSTIIFLLQ
jgi:hypothetical protein